jgi:hypothetical protein
MVNVVLEAAEQVDYQPQHQEILEQVERKALLVLAEFLIMDIQE